MNVNVRESREDLLLHACGDQPTPHSRRAGPRRGRAVCAAPARRRADARRWRARRRTGLLRELFDVKCQVSVSYLGIEPDADAENGTQQRAPAIK